METLGKLLMSIGVLLLLAGICIWSAADKLRWLGHLPGDIRITRPGLQVYIPITTMLLLSVILSLVMRVYNKWWR